MRTPLVAASIVLTVAAAACRGSQSDSEQRSDIAAFLTDVNNAMLRLGTAAQQASWTQATYITPDTEAMSARATEAYVTAITGYAKEAATLDASAATPLEQRQLTVLKNTLTMAAPSDPKEATELTEIAAAMEAAYGRGKFCPAGSEGDEACLDVEKVTEVLATSRDPKRLREVWEGWHTISPPYKQQYVRFVELSNKGAKELGYPDTGAMWRSKYDMPPDDFAKEMDRLWEQLRPLYLSLHTYVRTRLRQQYGDEVPADGPIPAHLLGNIWAQDWSNLFDIVTPPQSGAGVPLTQILKRRNTSPVDMVKYGEGFFTSLGFTPLPQTFWDRSLLTKPRDREVVCHASAWNINASDDPRIKMCIDQTAEDFSTVHHELGHIFYYDLYKDQPVVLREGANDGFHEAIGDVVALSVTPEYLVRIGLLDKAPDASGDLGLLMQRALEKVAFLPFGMVMDQWRWRVFSGEAGPDAYNRTWWELRERYQGVRAPSVRGEEFFDPGAKYHIPANTPYARYFLASILQFQFHRELAKAAGCTAPLHRCSIYGSEEAGERLRATLQLGASRPWAEALEALTGQKQMDATAMVDYFAPLKTWLDQQNAGRKAGW